MLRRKYLQLCYAFIFLPSFQCHFSFYQYSYPFIFLIISFFLYCLRTSSQVHPNFSFSLTLCSSSLETPASPQVLSCFWVYLECPLLASFCLTGSHSFSGVQPWGTFSDLGVSESRSPGYSGLLNDMLAIFHQGFDCWGNFQAFYLGHSSSSPYKCTWVALGHSGQRPEGAPLLWQALITVLVLFVTPWAKGSELTCSHDPKEISNKVILFSTW